VAFYNALGFEERRRLPIREEAINVFMGLPGDGDRLELTYNFGVDSYELGTAYGHIAITVDDMDATLEQLAGRGSSRSGRRTR
jgi:lactoylglutathione lyase